MTSYRFVKMAAGSHIGYDLGNVSPLTKCKLFVQAWSSNLVLIKFIVSELLRFLYLKLPIKGLFWGGRGVGAYFPQMT